MFGRGADRRGIKRVPCASDMSDKSGRKEGSGRVHPQFHITDRQVYVCPLTLTQLSGHAGAPACFPARLGL